MLVLWIIINFLLEKRIHTSSAAWYSSAIYKRGRKSTDHAFRDNMIKLKIILIVLSDVFTDGKNTEYWNFIVGCCCCVVWTHWYAIIKKFIFINWFKLKFNGFFHSPYSSLFTMEYHTSYLRSKIIANLRLSNFIIDWNGNSYHSEERR